MFESHVLSKEQLALAVWFIFFVNTVLNCSYKGLKNPQI